MNLSFRELLQNSEIWSEAISLLQTKYANEGFSGETISSDEIQHTYIKVIMKLLSLPCNIEDYSIYLTFIPKDSFNESEYIDVSVVDEITGINEDFNSLNWSRLVDLPITLDENIAHLDDSELLCELLWELTVWGFSEDMSVFSEKDKFTTFVSGFLRKDLDRN